MSKSAPVISPRGRRYAGSSADERRAQRRERLVDAGYDVFGREGYLKGTIRLVCAQARLTERYFYDDFANLEELYLAVHRRLSAEAGLRVAAAMSNLPPEDPIAHMRAALQAFFEYLKEDPRRAQIMLTDAVTTGIASPLNLQTHVKQFFDVFRLRLKQRYPAIDEPVEIEMIVGGFCGMVVNTGMQWVQRGFDLPVERIVAYNIYAWTGLHQWLAAWNQRCREEAAAKAQTQTPAPEAGEDPPHAD